MLKKTEVLDIDDDPLSSNIMTTTIAPNDFLLSIYKGNMLSNMDLSDDIDLATQSMNVLGHSKTSASSYKCCLCRKIVDDAKLTCAKCVNIGQFCPSKHDTCSHKRRQTLMNMLNLNDYEEFQQFSNKYSINTPAHLQCSDRMFLLKKFNIENRNLKNEYKKKMEPIMRLHEMSEEIQIRKNRLNLVNQSIERLRRQIEKNANAKSNIQQRIEKRRSRIQIIGKKITDIKQLLKSSTDEIKKKDDTRIDHENKLLIIRRQRLNEVYKYVFPIERVSLIEDSLASTMRALSSAQQPIVDEVNSESSENEEVLHIDDGYQIVHSCLPVNGEYQISKLLAADVVNKTADFEPHQATPLHELYEVLSALSHACQLINVIAFYLHITLPFRLHHLEFNSDDLTKDRLRADIAKLNANIVSSCLSQDIPIEDSHVKRTLENLWKLLTFKRYRSRPLPVVYSQQYINMMEEEVNEISRAYVTDYWFDDPTKSFVDVLNNNGWDPIMEVYDIPDDPPIPDPNSASALSSGQQHPSVMVTSIDYLKTRGSNLLNSMIRTFGR